MVFITINALYVSGGSSAHHQELKTVYIASRICQAFSASYRYRGLEPTHDSGKSLHTYEDGAVFRNVGT